MSTDDGVFECHPNGVPRQLDPRTVKRAIAAARWLVRRWMRLHRAELQAAWDDARAGRTPRKIEPLP